MNKRFKKPRKLPGLLPPYDEKVRIYTVVAATVQHPLVETAEGFVRTTPDTKTIVQPYGRQTAQHGHAISKVRVKMALKMVLTDQKTGKSRDLDDAWEPITTIVLQCRDSLELAHIKDLLEEADLPVEEFLDDNPEYGPGRVRTAISTYPVYAENVIGITDYLPLLRPPKE